MEKYINQNIIDKVKSIGKIFPETIFCGSFGLVYNHLLHREVNDLDVLVQYDYKKEGGFFDSYRTTDPNSSHRFMVGKDEVECFKLNIEGVKVDVLYNKNKTPEYDVVNFYGVDIFIETPESAINTKKQYVINDRSEMSILKHLKDLIYLEVEKNELIEIINNSMFYNKVEQVKNDDDPFGLFMSNNDMPF